MTWSLRGRLTLWYSAVVVALLVIGALAASFEQRRLALHRLDEELSRLMLTLEGVMRTELNEGLSLDESGKEASMEVVAPDRYLRLIVSEASTYQWGTPLPGAWPTADLGPGHHTLDIGGQPVRAFRRDINYLGHAYSATVGASLADLETQHRDLLVSIAVGGLAALAVASLGGWWIGRRLLRPLTTMARQAEGITERGFDQRLETPRRDDELGQLARAFNGLLARLATALNAQRQFMADASHELRTPVSIIRTAAQVTLARPERSDAEYRESLSIVAEQSARVTSVVDGMFLLARGEAAGLPMTRELLYLDDLTAECARGLQVLANDRQVTIHTTTSEEIALTADAVLLHRAITNLLDNAIRHAQMGGAVFVAVWREGAHAHVAVRDDGPGVAHEDRDRIFDRFVRRRTTASGSDGAGLGLPIARWIAEAHGGTLVLSPAIGAGAEFVLTLPAESPSPLHTVN